MKIYILIANTGDYDGSFSYPIAVYDNKDKMETDKENYLNKMKELSSIPEPFVRQSDDTDTWKEWDK